MKNKIVVLLVFISMIMASCSEYISDPTRPDIRTKAKKVQKERLRQYGPEN